jgi:hypothetical protein
MTRSEIITRFRARRHGKGWMALCPAHDDRNESLSIGEGKGGRILLKCFAGCETSAILAAVGLTERDLFQDGPKKAHGRKGLTLAEYAGAKRLPAEFLRELRVKETERSGRPALEVPYLGADGELICRRYRLAMHAEKRFVWEKGAKVGPYGLWRLAGARELGYITLVEGESDAQTLWHHGEPALGIPGAATWRDDWAECLNGFPRVYAAIEPDAGGRGFQTNLLQSPLTDRLWFVTLPGAKDASELHCQSPDAFKGCWREALGNAVSATQIIAPVLDALATFVRRFVVVSEAQACITALWVVHTHVFDAADATPYLSVTSPEKQSGKTRLLEVLETVVSKPWLTGRVSAAVLTRKIDAEQPTLLLDESDAAFSGEKEYAEALRGVLNTGHRRGGKASCCVGQGTNTTFRDFSTFCPKAIAGIGKLPDTVADRSVPVRLKRKAPGEHVERFRFRDVQSESSRLRAELQAWAAGAIEALRAARPQLPDQLSDRQQDCAEPLLAIADMAGGHWPDLAREALVELWGSDHAADDSAGVQLLADIGEILNERNADRISSCDLVSALIKIETSPWGEWARGKPLTQAALARLLRPFEISPRVIREGESTVRGYHTEAFRDALARYPRRQSVTPSQRSNDAGPSDFSGRNVVTSQKCENASENAGCDAVTVPNRSAVEEGEL